MVQTAEEHKAKAKERTSTPWYKAKKNETRANNRLKVLQYYSKQLSKSDIPCCKCCGENSHTEFLALDHIAGRKEIDSKPKLVRCVWNLTWFVINLVKKNSLVLLSH